MLLTKTLTKLAVGAAFATASGIMPTAAVAPGTLDYNTVIALPLLPGMAQMASNRQSDGSYLLDITPLSPASRNDDMSQLLCESYGWKNRNINQAFILPDEFEACAQKVSAGEPYRGRAPDALVYVRLELNPEF